VKVHRLGMKNQKIFSRETDSINSIPTSCLFHKDGKERAIVLSISIIGKYCVIGYNTGKIEIINTSVGKTELTIDLHSQPITQMDYTKIPKQPVKQDNFIC
jgi:hypothetical protein